MGEIFNCSFDVILENDMGLCYTQFVKSVVDKVGAGNVQIREIKSDI